MTKRQTIAALRGTEDLLPPASSLWQQIETTAADIFSRYGYEEIRTPLIEQASLFDRSVGSETEVGKEMYRFLDRSENLISLRPEGTAPVVRAYIASGRAATQPIARYWYRGPMFRYERPQKGRKREFNQIGCELFGTKSPYADAEVIAMAVHFFEALGVEGLRLEINSIGSEKEREAYNQKLVSYLKKYVGEFDDDEQRKLEKNPLRLLDSKKEKMQEILKKAPRISDSLSETSRAHFQVVQDALDAFGVAYVVNERIVRGLDYYTDTTFEFKTTQLGAQDAVCAGGRYDGLVEELGGPSLPGIGFALGMERLALLMEQQGKGAPPPARKIFAAFLSAAAVEVMLPHFKKLRAGGVRVEWDYEPRSMKAQMRRADKSGATFVIIAGDDELSRGEVAVRDMKTGEQQMVRLEALERHFVKVNV